jgi:hypothetical protein
LADIGNTSTIRRLTAQGRWTGPGAQLDHARRTMTATAVMVDVSRLIVTPLPLEGS